MHWRRKWQPTPVFLPGESQGRGSLVGCSPWGREESDTTEVTWQQQVGPSQVPLSNHPCVDLEQRVKIINCRHHLWSGVSRLLHVIFFFLSFFFFFALSDVSILLDFQEGTSLHHWRSLHLVRHFSLSCPPPSCFTPSTSLKPGTLDQGIRSGMLA